MSYDYKNENYHSLSFNIHYDIFKIFIQIHTNVCKNIDTKTKKLEFSFLFFLSASVSVFPTINNKKNYLNNIRTSFSNTLDFLRLISLIEKMSSCVSQCLSFSSSFLIYLSVKKNLIPHKHVSTIGVMVAKSIINKKIVVNQ